MLTHGGDLAGYLEEYGRMPLDFSANVSPLGLPERVRQAAAASLSHAGEYPDPLCRALRRAIAAQEGCSPEQVLCGAGAAELIFRLAFAVQPRTALVPAPTFAEYESALRQTGCRVLRHTLRAAEEFRLTGRILGDLDAGPELVFLCQPNNPTGQPADRSLALEILRRCERAGALLVMDECFADLLDEPGAFTLKPWLDSPNLLILKAFTKTYAMAGLRLGYCLCSNRALLDRMAACGQPWSVSGPAQAAGIAALGETAYLDTLRQLIRTERPRLIAGLERLGCTVTGSRANYVFFAARPGLDSALRRRGILIRSCSNYPGLDSRYYRAAVRTAADNNTLLAAVGQCLEEVSWQNPS